MMTLLQSALTGWTDYTQHGKFAALLLLAILYLGLSENCYSLAGDVSNSSFECFFIWLGNRKFV